MRKKLNKKLINFFFPIFLGILIFPILRNYKNYLLPQYHSNLNRIKENTLLGNDKYIQGRAFASIIKHDNKFKMFYSKITRKDNIFSINMRESFKLEDLKTSKEKKLIDTSDILENSKQIWMPYVFLEGDLFYMIFTTRKGNEFSKNYLEKIKIATSDNGFNWRVRKNPILVPKLDWEGRQVENWGIIKKDNKFYMSYESKGSENNLENRSVGIAYSSDLINWKRLKKIPFIKGNKCCSTFFKYKNFFYKIVPNGKKFAVYKFDDFDNFNEESRLGYWSPFGRKFNFHTVDTPDVITEDIKKTIKPGEPLVITYSLYHNGWLTLYEKYDNVEKFLKKILKD